MLHDGVLDRAAAGPGRERRHARRVAPSQREITLLWHDDARMLMRYTLLDESDGGFRIRTSMPLVEGTTGKVLRLLPAGERLDRPIMVRWSRWDGASGKYEVGLRMF